MHPSRRSSSIEGPPPERRGRGGSGWGLFPSAYTEGWLLSPQHSTQTPSEAVCVSRPQCGHGVRSGESGGTSRLMRRRVRRLVARAPLLRPAQPAAGLGALVHQRTEAAECREAHPAEAASDRPIWAAGTLDSALDAVGDPGVSVFAFPFAFRYLNASRVENRRGQPAAAPRRLFPTRPRLGSRSWRLTKGTHPRRAITRPPEARRFRRDACGVKTSPRRLTLPPCRAPMRRRSARPALAPASAPSGQRVFAGESPRRSPRERRWRMSQPASTFAERQTAARHRQQRHR
jgi:hypothetical protein